MNSKRATKEKFTSNYSIAIAMKGNTHEIPIINVSRRPVQAKAPVSFLCLSRQVSSGPSHHRRKQTMPDVEEAQFMGANFVAAELHRPSDMNVETWD
jgi:hypothetical protein